MSVSSGGFRGCPPTAQNFLDFMQFFGKFDKIVCWRPLEGGNPGFVPVHGQWNTCIETYFNVQGQIQDFLCGANFDLMYCI